MAYKDKPFRKPRQAGANAEDRQKTGHRKDNSRRFKEMERWMEQHVTGEGKTRDVATKVAQDESQTKMLCERELLCERESNKVAQDVVNEDEEDTQLNIAEIYAPSSGEEETQLNIAEIYLPSSEEDDVPIVQTLRAVVTPLPNRIPKDEQAVGQIVAKNFEAGLFQGQVASIVKRRGRCLYHIKYEDGDSEDMDELEYEDALFLYKKTQNVDSNLPRREETDSDMVCSDLEGSVYNNSDKDVTSEDEEKDPIGFSSPRRKGIKRKRKAKKVSSWCFFA